MPYFRCLLFYDAFSDHAFVFLCVSMDLEADLSTPQETPGPPPPLECKSILPLVTGMLITPKGTEPPCSRRIGVIGALVLILPSETV